MKKIIKAVCAAFVLTVIYSMVPFQAVCADITDDVFRMHIMANSDSEADQSLKLKVRDSVLKAGKTLFENAGTKEEAEALAAANLQTFADAAARTVRENGFDYPVKAEIRNMYFTTRYYDNYTLPSGMYDALRITIGNGGGHNWWCVMFPSVCLSDGMSGSEKAEEALDSDELEVVRGGQREYKFWIVELFEKARSLLNIQDE